MDSASPSTFVEAFWDFSCGVIPMFTLLFVANVVFLVMLAVSFLYVEPGTQSYVLAQLSLIIVAVALVSSGYVVRRCRRRRGEL